MNPLHETALLIEIVGERWDEARALAAARPVDPARFVAVAREADVHPWVHALLEGSENAAIVGRETMTRLESLRRKVASDNLLLLARLEEALDVLAEKGIVPALLKGSDFLHRFYRRFDERTLDDVDLLVRPSEVGRALDALSSRGWVAPEERERLRWLRSSHHLPLDSPGPVTVHFEIHWNLVQERRYRLDPRDLFARARTIDIAGRKVSRLEDHDAAAHLLLHHVSHYFDRRLKWAIDLSFLATSPGFRWETVAERVQDWGGAQSAGMALRHLRRIAPHAVPEGALDRLPVARWRLAATAPLRSSHPLEIFRRTRDRFVQRYLGAVLLERPLDLPGYLWHRRRRERVAGESPVEREPGVELD